MKNAYKRDHKITSDARVARFSDTKTQRASARHSESIHDNHSSGWSVANKSTQPATSKPRKAASADSKVELPTDDNELRALLRRKIKAKIDVSEKNRLFEKIVANSIYKQSDLNRFWKEITKDIAKNKSADPASGKFFPDVDGDFPELCKYAEMRIATVNDQSPFLFGFSDEMARVSSNGEGVARIETLNLARFRHQLNAVSKWTSSKTVAGEVITRLSPAPSEVADHLFNGSYKALPTLRRLVTVPTYTNRRRLCSVGFSEGLYYHPKVGLTLSRPVLSPTPEQVKEAVNALADVFADFSLDGKSRAEFMDAIENGDDLPSFAHLLSYGLTSFCREMIKGPIPGHLARKDQPRSGATLAMTTMEQIATTYPASPLLLPSREDEIGKVLLSELLVGPPYILFDNLPEGIHVESDAIATAITSYPNYKGRVLGVSQIKSVPANAVFGFTGNRTALSTQLVERMLLISVAPQVENPGARAPATFKYPLPDHVTNNAARYFGYMLILVQNWIANGCPEWTGVSLGGFQAHASVVGGILDAAGIKGFMGNRDDLTSLVKVDDPMNEFMDAMIAVHSELKGNVVFKAGDAGSKLPPELAGKQVRSFADILTASQIRLKGWGYQYRDDDIIYPTSANSNIAQKIRGLNGKIRGDFKFVEVNLSTKKFSKYYELKSLTQNPETD